MKTHAYSTHHKSSLNVPKSQSDLYRKSFLYQSIVSYQTVPTSVKAWKMKLSSYHIAKTIFLTIVGKLSDLDENFVGHNLGRDLRRT